MLTVKIIEARSLEPVCVKGRRWLQTPNPTLSSFVAVHHGSQSKMTHIANEVDNPHWDSVVEVWDNEMCETLEFIVVLRAGTMLWKHSMVTMNMEQFRAQPEHRIDAWVLLGSVSKPDPAASSPILQSESFGELHLVVTYTEDCYQPTLLQSVFCNIMLCPLPNLAQHRKLAARAVPRSLPRWPGDPEVVPSNR